MGCRSIDAMRVGPPARPRREGARPRRARARCSCCVSRRCAAQQNGGTERTVAKGMRTTQTQNYI
eukprot:scaffold13507_cov127-Isochrysis_galbana.AAC.1